MRALLLGLLFTISSAQAALLIEPHIGYGFYPKDTTDANSEFSYNAPEYGLRLGYQNFGFMAGMGYTRTDGTMDKKSALGVKSDQTFQKNEVGVFAGYNFPILLRVWGAYYFSNKTKFGAGGDGTFSGNTAELGLGLTALPFLSVNIAYKMVHYDNGLDLNGVVFGVSLPLTL